MIKCTIFKEKGYFKNVIFCQKIKAPHVKMVLFNTNLNMMSNAKNLMFEIFKRDFI